MRHEPFDIGIGLPEGEASKIVQSQFIDGVDHINAVDLGAMRKALEMIIDYPVGDRLRRSVLVSTGDNRAGLEAAATSDADVVMIELEDIVVADKKVEAREGARVALRDLDWNGKERLIRVNAIHSEYGRADLEMAVSAGADAVMLPKITGPADIVAASDLLLEFEASVGRSQQTQIWAMIESARALQNVDAIATAHPRMTAIMFGGGDLGADLGLRRLQFGKERTLGPIRYEYLYGYSRVVVAARAAGISPINLAYGSSDDLEGTQRDAEFSAQFGFDGSLALTPQQVCIINREFSPTADDLSWATDIVNSQGPTGPYGRCARRFIALDAMISATS